MIGWVSEIMREEASFLVEYLMGSYLIFSFQSVIEVPSRDQELDLLHILIGTY